MDNKFRCNTFCSIASQWNCPRILVTFKVNIFQELLYNGICNIRIFPYFQNRKCLLTLHLTGGIPYPIRQDPNSGISNTVTTIVGTAAVKSWLFNGNLFVNDDIQINETDLLTELIFPLLIFIDAILKAFGQVKIKQHLPCRLMGSYKCVN